MKFKLEMDLDNAAFDTDTNGMFVNGDEIARILTQTGKSISGSGHLASGEGSTVMDINGNTVGTWKIEP